MKRLAISLALVIASIAGAGSAAAADLPAYLTRPAIAAQAEEAPVDLARWGRRYYGGYVYYGRPTYVYRPYTVYRPYVRPYVQRYYYRPYYYGYNPYYYNYRPYVYSYGPYYYGGYYY